MDLWTFYPSNLLEAPILIVSPPLAITLLDFRAGVEGHQVVVRWITGTERNTVGFHLLRSASGARAEAVSVTDALILARGSAATGASYRWADPETTPGDAVAYWLQEVEHSGVVHEYGPALRMPGAGAESGFTIWLPVL